MALNLPHGFICHKKDATQKHIDAQVALHWMPGEKVKMAADEWPKEVLVRRDDWQSLSWKLLESKAEALTVKQFILKEWGHVAYTFEEVDGEWETYLVQDARDRERILGVFAQIEADMWFIPFEDENTLHRHADPFKVSPAVERKVGHMLQISSIAELHGQAALAEFVTAADGAKVLAYAPCSVWASKLQKKLANEAMAEMTAPSIFRRA
jgi:hypothetical protein